MEKKRAVIYLLLLFGLNLFCSSPLFIFKSRLGKYLDIAVMITGILFMFLPVLAVCFTRMITGDKARVAIRPHLKRDLRYYLSACFLPGFLVAAGAALFFAVFPKQLDLSWAYTSSLFLPEPPFRLTVPIVMLAGLIMIPAAPLVIINHILAFGEEYGWRGYFLKKLLSFMSVRQAVIVSGIFWGLCHAPLVCFGLNYNFGYPGYPWSGILMMTVFASVIGAWFSYLTLRTDSVIAASIAHGAMNAVREVPLFIAALGVNTLLGPKPSGLIGMSGFLITAVWCLWFMGREKGNEEKNSWK